MKKTKSQFNLQSGFSLGELLAALAVTSMIAIVTLHLYASARSVESRVNNYLSRTNLPGEIIQRITSDIDRYAMSGVDSRMIISRKTQGQVPLYRFEIISSVYDKDSKPMTFRHVIWQTYLDEMTQSIMLYRSYSGMNGEDTITNKDLEQTNTQLFVPMCIGLTHFQFTAISDGKESDIWQNTNMPDAVFLEVSFAQPTELYNGELGIDPLEITKKRIVIDKTKKLAFKYVEPTFDVDESDSDTKVDLDSVLDMVRLKKMAELEAAETAEELVSESASGREAVESDEGALDDIN